MEDDGKIPPFVYEQDGTTYVRLPDDWADCTHVRARRLASGTIMLTPIRTRPGAAANPGVENERQ